MKPAGRYAALALALAGFYALWFLVFPLHRGWLPRRLPEFALQALFASLAITAAVAVCALAPAPRLPAVRVGFAVGMSLLVMLTLKAVLDPLGSLLEPAHFLERFHESPYLDQLRRQTTAATWWDWQLVLLLPPATVLGLRLGPFGVDRQLLWGITTAIAVGSVSFVLRLVLALESHPDAEPSWVYLLLPLTSGVSVPLLALLLDKLDLLGPGDVVTSRSPE